MLSLRSVYFAHRILTIKFYCYVTNGLVDCNVAL